MKLSVKHLRPPKKGLFWLSIVLINFNLIFKDIIEEAVSKAGVLFCYFNFLKLSCFFFFFISTDTNILQYPFRCRYRPKYWL